MPIELIDKIKPKNNGTFPMVDAKDVSLGGIENQRLTDALLTPLDEDIYIKTVLLTQEEYDALEEYDENTLYMIYTPGSPFVRVIPITIVENGVYVAEGGIGYSPVTVNIPSAEGVWF